MSSIWQTKNWQEMVKKSGQSENFFCIDGIFVEKRRIFGSQFGLFILGVTDHISDSTQKKLINICKEENTVFIQIETLSYQGKFPIITHKYDFSQGFFKKFIPSYSAIIDLKKNEKEIFSSMKQKGRYNIRLAKKKGVVVKKVGKSRKNIVIFSQLMDQTALRDGFSQHSVGYFESFLSTIKESEFFFAYYKGEVIAGGIFIFSGDVFFYYYGASANAHRDVMASYLLQWEAIVYGKKMGSHIYDFLGVASLDDKKSSLAGVTNFKKKFTPDILLVSQSYIWINKKFCYNFIVFIRFFKKIFTF